MFSSSPSSQAASQKSADHPFNETSTAAEGRGWFQPVLDFTRPDTINMIERLDDVIMGGVSTSTVVSVTELAEGEGTINATTTTSSYAKWVGICRTDGGGFCGFRTNPLDQGPLRVDPAADGIYVDLRLVSDADSSRRVWKLTTRTEPSRGERLYQAPIVFHPSADTKEWTRVKVPFSSFRYVSGPRNIPEGPPLNTTGGLYQIGMTLSKFLFGQGLTELENFRPGFFELHIREIGFYKQGDNVSTTPEAAVATANIVPQADPPKVLTREQAKKRRSLLLKLLLPLSKLFFTEKSQRRKVAMKVLLEKRGLNRGQAMWFGFQSRRQSFGILPSLAQTLSIVAVDVFRSIVGIALRVVLVYPLRMMSKVIGALNPKKAKN